MSKSVARIMLAIFMLPLAAMFFMCICVVGERSSLLGPFQRREDATFFLASLSTWVVFGGYWVAIWYHSVRWTRERKRRSAISAACCALFGIICAVFFDGLIGGSFGSFCGAAMAPLLWWVSTVFIWRETTVEQIGRDTTFSLLQISCLKCEYSMKGLKSTQCPECGTLFTLDELLAAQIQPKALE